MKYPCTKTPTFAAKTYALSHLAKAGVALLLTTWASGAQGYNPAQEFAISANPNGVWSYGYSQTLGSPMTAYGVGKTLENMLVWLKDTAQPDNDGPEVYYNPTDADILVLTALHGSHQLAQHPGPNGEYSAIRFTCPAANAYRVTGSFYGEDIMGTTTDVHILVNGVSVFDGVVNGFGTGSGPTFDETLTLNAGDRLDFAVGPDNQYNNDSTALSLEIATIPEPTTASLLPLAAATSAAMIARRRRRMVPLVSLFNLPPCRSYSGEVLQ